MASRWTAGRVVRAALLLIVLLPLAVGGWLLLSDELVTVRPAQRVGPPALVQAGEAPVLWLLTRQEESRPGRGSARTRSHFDLHGHDPATTRRLWTRRLLTVQETQGAAEARILGQQGPVVWLFLNDQPVALSAADGSVRGGRLALLERNPGLAPMWPDKRAAFTFDETLIVTTADALLWRVDGTTLAASGYRPEDPERLRRAQFTSGSWNGSYRTADFLTRHQRDIEDRWIGLFSEREAAEAALDGFGSHFKNPDAVFDEGASARRSLWLGTIGKTREFSEGRHDRLTALTPLAPGQVYLQGGLLRTAGRREALRPGPDGGMVVLHRTRVDDQGRLVLTRLTPMLTVRWSTPLPIAELHNRWELMSGLLMMGSTPAAAGSAGGPQEWLLSLDISSGQLQQFDLQGARSD